MNESTSTLEHLLDTAKSHVDVKHESAKVIIQFADDEGVKEWFVYSDKKVN